MGAVFDTRVGGAMKSLQTLVHDVLIFLVKSANFI